VAQQELVQDCEAVSRNWGRSVWVQQEVGQECERVFRNWGMSVNVSM